VSGDLTGSLSENGVEVGPDLVGVGRAGRDVAIGSDEHELAGARGVGAAGVSVRVDDVACAPGVGGDPETADVQAAGRRRGREAVDRPVGSALESEQPYAAAVAPVAGRVRRAVPRPRTRHVERGRQWPAAPALGEYAHRMWTRHEAALARVIAEESGLEADSPLCAALAHLALEAPASGHGSPHWIQAVERAFDILELGWAALSTR
jgi:hypothetical protein